MNRVHLMIVGLIAVALMGQMPPEEAQKALEAAKPTYEQLERENARLRTEVALLRQQLAAAEKRIAELEPAEPAQEVEGVVVLKREVKYLSASHLLKQVPDELIPETAGGWLSDRVDALRDWADQHVVGATVDGKWSDGQKYRRSHRGSLFTVTLAGDSPGVITACKVWNQGGSVWIELKAATQE